MSHPMRLASLGGDDVLPVRPLDPPHGSVIPYFDCSVTIELDRVFEYYGGDMADGSVRGGPPEGVADAAEHSGGGEQGLLAQRALLA